ncbi:MAG: hypothetical protein IPG44_14960 [Anaerolineales bacterium]|jgi:hypothetical protein|nr:hypothetical protein [Chloroflexota bacterium]MBK6647019.1 hypothetical protein [Anaerolineales bacterium]
MRPRRPILTTLLIASLVTTLACNLGSASPSTGEAQPTSDPAQPAPPTPEPAAGLCDNALYPVRQGAAWTYQSTGSPSGDFSYTDTITEVRADGFTLSTQFTGLTRTQEWICETGGLKALQMGGAGAAASVSTQGTTAEFTTSDVTGISLPREITPGMQWQYSLTMTGVTAMPGDQNAQSSGTFNLTMQEMGKETVSVPAGTFEAVKFQAASLIQLTADFQGVQVPVTMNGSSLVWYAPGVGFIKSVENSDFGGTPYTSTTELQTYGIP